MVSCAHARLASGGSRKKSHFGKGGFPIHRHSVVPALSTQARAKISGKLAPLKKIFKKAKSFARACVSTGTENYIHA